MSVADNINPAIAHVPLTTPKDLTRVILRQIAEEHGVTVQDLMSKARSYRVSRARFAALRRLLEVKPSWTIADAGRFFGMDHTSALHALDQTGGGRLGRELGRSRSTRNALYPNDTP